jgi:hypothetical protein
MKKVFYIAVLLIGIVSCVEEVAIEEQETADLLVVEATLTDEFKRHQVRLTRSFGFGADSVPPETRAQVSIQINDGATIPFSHTGDGIYISDLEFAAETGRSYELIIASPEGTVYRSSAEELPGTATIDELYAVRENNENGTDGVFIYLDGSPEQGNADYYRYEYEETYKIIAPFWSPQDFLLTDYDPCALPSITYNLEIVPREEEQQVCFQTVPSSRVLQNDVTTLSSSRIERFPIRFLGATDFMISHRYSILVRQYVQSPTAFSYFQSLESFSSSENVFNSVQPGFLTGNIQAAGNSEAPVIGFFEVTAVSEQRLFFNFEDLFPDLEKPPYVTNCQVNSAPLEHISYCFPGDPGPNPCPLSIVERVNQGSISYFLNNEEMLGECPGPYQFVERVCGDCTLLGSNKVPEFWIE